MYQPSVSILLSIGVQESGDDLVSMVVMMRRAV
jgi:hypothetical protein